MCSNPDCDKPGWCRPHYMERYMVDYEAKRDSEPCSVADCKRSNYRRGFCTAHYPRWLKYGDPMKGGPFRAVRGTGDRWKCDEDRRAARAKMSQVSGETAEYVKMLRKDSCVYCGKPCEHIDHIVPFVDGGPTDWSNLAPTCASCNLRKNRKSLLGFLLQNPVGSTHSR